MPAPQINWDAMYRDFTQGYWRSDFSKGIHRVHYPTVAELAEKYECAEGTIRDRFFYDKKKGIDWRNHRKSIQAKRNDEAAAEGGRFGFYVTESAKLDAIALAGLESLLSVAVRDIKLLDMQGEEDSKLVEANPDNLQKLKFQRGLIIQSYARTLDLAMERKNKIVGEPLSGMLPESEKEQSKVTVLPGEIDKLIERRKHLQERRERINARKAERMDEGAG